VVTDLATPATPDLKSALAQDALATLGDGPTFKVQDVVLLPLIPNADKIFCVGLNYATHVAETGREQKEHPAIFQRWNDTLIADGQPMVRPPESIRFDYEGELAIIIGKAGRRIARQRLGPYRGLCGLQRRLGTRLAAPQHPVHAGQELARHRRLWPCAGHPR
jgi:2-keto-4-pentenoate hydratase/2-oxohepta-3-ene-1,7-dioic acid hydratase in catechol pathway